MSSTRLAWLALPLLAACSGPAARAEKEQAAAASSETAPADTAAAPAEPLTFNSGLAGFQLRIPASWGREFSVSERAEPAEYPGATHVVEFLHLGSAGGTPPTILGIVTYDAAGWEAVERSGSRPKGEVVARQAGRVFVAVRQDNPYPAGSPDAQRFDRTKLTAAELRDALDPG